MEPPFSFLACFAFILWGKSPRFVSNFSWVARSGDFFSEEYRLSYIDIQFRPDTITTMMIFNVYQPSLTHSHLFLQWIHFDSHQMDGLHRK